MNKLVLASGSPRRKMLLEWAELKFDVLVKETEEVFPEGMSIGEVPVYIASNKARAVQESDLFRRYENKAVVLAADTIVVLDAQVLGKPADREEAIRMLCDLSGRDHEVITGVVIRNNMQEISFSDRTRVWFHELNRAQVEYYVDKYQPFDKAGAYAIQEWIGVVGIRKIEGDFYNVMGLPVSRVLKALDSINNA